MSDFSAHTKISTLISVRGAFHRRLSGPFWLILQPVIFHWQALISRKGSIPFDLPSFHTPLAVSVVEALREHRFPWWDPYIYAGYPIHADVQAQILYPPAWLVFWTSVFQEHKVFYWLEWETVLHLSLAGLLTWLLLRRCGCGRWPALFGATVYQLGAFFCSQVQHLGAVCGAAWMPLAWLAVIELARGFSAPWFAALAASLALSFLAGFASTTLIVYGSALAVACGLWASRRARAPVLLWTAAGMLASIPLVAAQLVPTALWTSYSAAGLRWMWASGGGLPVKALCSLLWPDWFHVFTPSRYQEPYNLTFMYVYHGQAALWLVLVAPWLRTRLPARLFAGLTFVFMLVMVGTAVPGYKFMFNLLPRIVRGSLYVEFAMAAFSLAFAITAALALERFTVNRRAWLAATIALVTSAELLAVPSKRMMNYGESRWKQVDSPKIWLEHASVLDEVRRWVRATVPPQRTDTMQPEFRFVTVAQAIRLPSLGGDNPFAPVRMLEYRQLFCKAIEWERFYTVENAASPLLQAGNVGFLLHMGKADNEEVLRQAGWEPINWKPPVPLEIFRQVEPMPRYFLVNAVRRVDSASAARGAMRRMDPRRIAIVEGGIASQTATPGQPGRVQVVSYRADRVELRTKHSRPAYLVIAESWAPDWRATVDGHPAALYPTNLAFQGLPLAAGIHGVTLEYVPEATYAAMWTSGLAWLGLAGYAASRRRNHLRRQKPMQPQGNADGRRSIR